MSTPVREQERARISSSASASRQSAGESGPLTGLRIGDYQLRDLLGVGGMAEVYRGLDTGLDREVAVKVLSGPLASDAGYVRRFRDEARRLAALGHPHIVPIYAFGEDPQRGLLYLVMPVVPGSLRDYLMAVGRLPVEEATDIVDQIASGLQVAHAAGFVHRDVKPENILLDAQGQALLTDFGIAREVTVLRQAGTMRTLSSTGLPVGTPEYMAPEQLRGESADQRVDVYALGAVLYELLTGRVPHDAPTPYEVAALALMAPLTPPSVHNPRIDHALERVILRALARNPDDRYLDVQAFAAALRKAVALPSGSDPLAYASGDEPLETEITAPMLVVRLPGDSLSTAPTSGALPYLPSEDDTHSFSPAFRFALPALAILPALPVTLAASMRKTATVALAWLRRLVPPAGSPRRLTIALPSAVLLITLLSVGAFAMLLSHSAPPTRLPTVFHMPTVTPTHILPTPTSTTTPLPPPPLVFSPATLVLHSGDGDLCTATQRITNETRGSLGWRWLSPRVSGFTFQIDNGHMTDDWPTNTDPGIAVGGSDTLQVWAHCSSSRAPITVRVSDTLGNEYTLIIQFH